MSGVEFVPQPEDDDHDAPHRGTHRGEQAGLLQRVPRRMVLMGCAVVAAVVALTVVVAQRPDGRRADAASSHSPSTSATSPRPTPSPTVSTLALPEQLAFGPQTTSVYAIGNRIYGLTPRLVGAVQRDGGELVVRPTTGGLISGTPKLFVDERYAIVWTVAIGGTSIGSFDTEDLATRADQTAPGKIRAATAYRDELWFVTAKGLYRIAPGQPAAKLVSARSGLVALAADPTRHRVVTIGRAGLEVFLANGDPGLRAPLPFLHPDDIAVADGQIWVAGHYDRDGLLFHVDPATLHPLGPAPSTGSTGGPSVLTTFRNRLVVAGTGPARTMSCLDAATGRTLQTWPYLRGAVALNERGMLVSQGYGIEKRDSRECLVGTS